MRSSNEYQPLAARMRPSRFEQFVGQEHLVGSGAAFRVLAENDRLGSVILWGPPGVGKTTLAELVATTTQAAFHRVSAVSAGVSDLRKIADEAKKRRVGSALGADSLFAGAEEVRPNRTILFIDEIHRFSKAQQDAILPFVEDGTLTLIGATTENPSFEVNAALLSRSQVYVLKALTDENIQQVLEEALNDAVRGLGAQGLSLEPAALSAIVNLSNGDARSALNMLEMSAQVAASTDTKLITLELVESAIQRRTVQYDKSGEQHYDLISALHKSVRGSDVDASLYWLARMLEGGEDPMYLARRIVRMATEDIGLADPRALPLCVAAQQAVHFIGMPEGGLALAEAVAYLAASPKSNAVYVAFKAAQRDVQATRNDPVPLHLRNAPTKLMKELDYGSGYQYAHDYEGGLVGQQNLPDALADRAYYHPTNRGFEANLIARIEQIRQLNRDASR